MKEDKKYVEISLGRIIAIITIILIIAGIIFYFKKTRNIDNITNNISVNENASNLTQNISEDHTVEQNVVSNDLEESQYIISSEIEQDEKLLYFLKEIGYFNALKDGVFEENLTEQEFYQGIKLDNAADFVYEKMFKDDINRANQLRLKKDDINIAIKEIFNENVSEVINSPASLLKYEESSDSYIYKEAGDDEHSVYIIKATSQINTDGTNKITFLYAYPSEGDIIEENLDNYDCYRCIVNVKENENYQYSAYKLIDILPLSSRIIGKVKDFK